MIKKSFSDHVSACNINCCLLYIAGSWIGSLNRFACLGGVIRYKLVLRHREPVCFVPPAKQQLVRHLDGLYWLFSV